MARRRSRLRRVHGVTNEALHASAFTMAIGTNQVRVQVPGPIALLKAKIANAADIAQTGRQDGRHVVILAQLMSAFLTDLVSRWRWIVTPADAETIIRCLTADITYSNFKGTVARQPDQSAKLRGLHDIWALHHGWQASTKTP